MKEVSLVCFLLGAFFGVTLVEGQGPDDTARQLKMLGTTTNLTTQTGMQDEQVVENFSEHPEVTRMLQYFQVEIAKRGATRMTTLVPTAAGFSLGGSVYVLGYKTALQKDTEVYYIRAAIRNDNGTFAGYSFIFHVKITVEIAPGKCHWYWSPSDLEGNIKNARLILVVGPKPDNTPLNVAGDFKDENVQLIGRSLPKATENNLFLKLSSNKNINTLKAQTNETKENSLLSTQVDELRPEIMKLGLALIQKTNPAFPDFKTKDSVGKIAYLSNKFGNFARILIDSQFIFHLKFDYSIVDGKLAKVVKVTGPKDVGDVINPNEF